MNSIKKRKKNFRNSIKEISRSSERSKMTSRGQNFRHRLSNPLSQQDKENTENLNIQNNDSIFDNLPEKI